MIIQGLLDLMSQWISGVLGLIPPMPQVWADSLAWATDGASWMGGQLALLGPLVPWAVLTVLVNAWFGALAFWAAMTAIRTGLWILGR